VRKRHSTRTKQGSGGQGNDNDIVETVSEVPEKAVRPKKLENTEKLTPSIPKELVAEQTRGSEKLNGFLNRITIIEEVVHRMEQKVDKLVVAHDAYAELLRQFERKVEEDGVVMSAQSDVIEQWKQEAGALVTTLRQVVGSLSTPAVSTVEAVEKDVGHWGSVLARKFLRWVATPLGGSMTLQGIRQRGTTIQDDDFVTARGEFRI
jgi:hypothetical protein